MRTLRDVLLLIAAASTTKARVSDVNPIDPQPPPLDWAK